MADEVTEASPATSVPESTPVDGSASSAPSEEGHAPQPAPETPFTDVSLDDIEDPRARAYVESKRRQMQADYTRKSQANAEAVRMYEDLYSDDEETQQQALQQLLDERGYEFDPGDDAWGGPEDDPEALDADEAYAASQEEYDPEAEYEYEADGEYEGEEDDGSAELEHRLALLEQEREQERLSQEDDYLQQFVDHHISAYAQELGVDELDDATREQLVAHATVLEPDEYGRPNMEQAIANHAQWRADIEKAAIDRYLTSKRAPRAEVSGSSGVPIPGPMETTKQRLERGLEIAGRHL